MHILSICKSSKVVVRLEELLHACRPWAVLLLTTVSAFPADKGKEPIGAWFGIARPCTPPPPAVGLPLCEDGQPVEDFLPDPSVCEKACGGECSENSFPLLQLTMMPTLLADGTVLADDFAEVFGGHTTAQGEWGYVGKELLDGEPVERYRATFVSFTGQGGQFTGSLRSRFVTFFDRRNPRFMRGFVQLYV